MIVPTFDEYARMPGIVIRVPDFSGVVSSNRVSPLRIHEPGSGTAASGAIAPVCSPVASVITLCTEPGSTTIWVGPSIRCTAVDLSGCAAS